MTPNKKKAGIGEFVLMSDLIPGQLYRIKPILTKQALDIRLATMVTVVRPHPKVTGYWIASYGNIDTAKINADHHKIPAYHLKSRMAMYICQRWPGNDSWGVFLVGERFLVLEGYHLESNQPVKWPI